MNATRIITLILSTVYLNFTNAQTKSIFDLMNHSEVLNMTLEADFSALKENRRTDDSHKGKLTFEDADAVSQNWNIKIKLRGKFRRLNCEMPPLKLDFKKGDLEEKGLADFDDLKLVTQCTDDKNEAKAFLMKEYLTYKMYNELTDYSYRVQLVRITYKDTSTGKKSKEWAFLIEDTAQLAARLKAEKVSAFTTSPREFSSTSVKQATLFQYIIGNADWELSTGRNIKLFLKDGILIPVPYDFDFSGLVNASYAIPNADYDLSSIKERVIPQLPKQYHDLHGTIYYFVGKKEKLFDVIQNFKYLSRTDRTEMVDYLNTYFVNADNLRFVERKSLTTAP